MELIVHRVVDHTRDRLHVLIGGNDDGVVGAARMHDPEHVVALEAVNADTVKGRPQMLHQGPVVVRLRLGVAVGFVVLVDCLAEVGAVVG